MYNRVGNSTVPTLTDHFKQALSMTRAQLQSGPSPLTSASQMGVGNSPFVNPVNNGLTVNVPLPPAQEVGVFGSPTTSEPSAGNGTFTDILMTYGKWVLLALIVAGAIGAYFWWKKRKAVEEDVVEGITTNDQSPQRFTRPIQRFNNNHNNASPLRLTTTLPPSSIATSPLPPTNNHSPENLRDNEQHSSLRGAEFSNPSMMTTHMIPMSTRVKPQEPTQEMPPTDLPRQSIMPSQSVQLQQSQPQQPQLQQLPPVSAPIPQQPQISLPISHQPPPQLVSQQLVSSQPIQPTQLIAPSLPISSQPDNNMSVPVSNLPSQNQTQSDPNFTAI